MVNLTGILNILEVCLWLGVIIICIVLVVSGVLRWLAPTEDRSKKLNIAGWIAFATLATMILYSRRAGIVHLFADPDGSHTLTAVIINGSKMAVKLLLLGAVFVIAAIILLVFIVLVSKGVRAAFYVKDTKVESWAERLKEKSNQFGAIIKTPIFTFFVTCGILLVFIILPFLLGNSDGKAGLAETWINGVQTFASAVRENEDTAKSVDANTDQNTVPEGDTTSDGVESQDGNASKTETVPIPEAVITYILVYVIVLGVGFAITRILYAIVKDNLKQKQTATLIDTYSSPMGVLGVGVSILLVLQDNEVDIYQDKLLDVVGAFFKYFVIVAIVMALAITILEIIHLVMDMRETLIRREARYLFVALVGHASLLILTALNSFFSALNSVIDQKNDKVDINQIQHKLIQRITETMDQEIDQRKDDRDVTFIIFKESVTKK